MTLPAARIVFLQYADWRGETCDRLALPTRQASMDTAAAPIQWAPRAEAAG